MKQVSARERGGFRRRLTLAFVLVAAISTGTLALISFLLVKQDRSASFLERSLDKAQLALTLAESRLSPAPSTEEIDGLIEALKRRAGIELVVISNGRTSSSIPGFDIQPALEGAEDDPTEEGFRKTDLRLEEDHYLLVTPVDNTDPELYFLFSRANLDGQMEAFSTLLWRLWLALAFLSALAGHIVAKRTLKPIAKAGEAAIALAEGMLETRLPIERRDEFGAWADSFNRMASALEEKINELEAAAARERRFTSDVAHELRTPLSALVTSTQMLASANSQMGSEAAWAAERVSSQVKRLRRLVEELLEISRLDAHREPLIVTQVDLRDLISRLLQHRGWTVRVQAVVDEGDIATDPRRMDRIVGNLISNSIEHGGGTITLRATVEDSEVVVAVCDEGPGIPAADAERVFDRFYKADPARPGGSGLGLSIALENARLLGGDITLSSTPDGTTFTARLPKTPPGGTPT